MKAFARSMLLFACISINQYCSTASPIGSENAVAWIDEVYSTLSNLIKTDGFDPVSMADDEIPLNRTLIIDYFGGFNVTNGQLRAMSTIRRQGDVILEPHTNYLIVTVPTVFDNLEFSYDYKAQLMGLVPSGRFRCNLSTFQVDVNFLLDRKILVVWVGQSTVEQVGKIEVSFTGDALVDWFSELLTGVISSTFISTVQVMVVGNLATELGKMIETINGMSSPPDFTTLSTRNL